MRNTPHTPHTPHTPRLYAENIYKIKRSPETILKDPDSPDRPTVVP